MVRSTRFWTILTVLCFSAIAARAQGVIAPTAGPINSSMAGASVAAPLDFGASYWNPAAISGLDQQEFLIGSQLIFPSIHLDTSLKAGSIGPFPANTRSGVTRSDSGVASNIATGGAFRLSEDSSWTFGLGIFGMVGGGVNYPGSTTQPILAPRRPPRYFGFGPLYSNLSILEITPMLSNQVSDQLALAFGPVITTGTASFNPAIFAPGPKDAFGIPTFPAATNSKPVWGGGFQLGLLYNINKDWNFGFSYKSPIWQNRWDYNAANPDSSARRIGIQAQIPQILSWGVAYKGFSKTLIDVDLRYFDYRDTSLFGQRVINGGLGWNSVFAVATGVQYQATDKVTVRAGYLFNTNPIPTTATLFNLQAPAITTNTLSLGASYQVNDNIVLSSAWVHGFRNTLGGSLKELPGAVDKFDVQTDSLVFGLNVKFGAKKSDKRSASLAKAEALPPLPDNGTE